MGIEVRNDESGNHDVAISLDLQGWKHGFNQKAICLADIGRKAEIIYHRLAGHYFPPVLYSVASIIWKALQDISLYNVKIDGSDLQFIFDTIVIPAIDPT